MRLLPALAATLLLVASVPAGTGQPLSQRLADLRFPAAVVTVGPEEILLVADRATIMGTTATELRRCIDKSNCPDPQIAMASQGNGDGRVDTIEVDGFTRTLLLGLNLASDDVAEFKTVLRTLVTVDNLQARTVRFTAVELRGAEGPTDSSNPVYVTLRLLGDFGHVADASRHEIRIARTQSSLNVTDRIVVEPAAGWTIRASSIEPAELRDYFGDGRLEASQDEFEGAEPLTFSLQKRTGPGTWLLWIGLLLLAGAISFFALAYYRRRKG